MGVKEQQYEVKIKSLVKQLKAKQGDGDNADVSLMSADDSMNTEEQPAENISMNASQIEQTLININLEDNKNYQELIQIIEQQKREKQRIELRLKNSSDAERRRALELEQVKASEKTFKQLNDKNKHELKMILGIVGDKTQAENLLESKKQSEKTIRMQVKKINELEAHVVTMTGDVSKKDEENSQISKELATAL